MSCYPEPIYNRSKTKVELDFFDYAIFDIIWYKIWYKKCNSFWYIKKNWLFLWEKVNLASLKSEVDKFVKFVDKLKTSSRFK